MNNYNFTQSLDGLNNIEADNINTSNLNVGSLIVDSAEITTLSDCNLVNCTAETPLNPTSVVNKTYVDNNFVYKTGSVTEDITGLKTFTDNLTAPNIFCNTALYFRDIDLTVKKALIFHQADIVYFDTLTIYDNYWKFKCFNIDQVVISQLSSTFNNKLISLAQARFENFTPTCLVSTPTQINHLTRKDYVDNNFVYKTGSITENIDGLKTFTNNTTFNAQATFNNFTPICSVSVPTANNHLTRKDYVDNNFVDKTTTQTIAGDQTYNGNATYNGTGLFCNCPGQFYNLVHLRSYTRVYDIASPFTNYTKLYTSGNNFFVYPEFTSSTIQLFCRNSANNEVQSFSSAAIANTSYVPFIASSTSTFNGQASFNNSCPISTTNATISTHLTTLGFNDGKYVDFASVQSISGIKTFLSAVYLKNEMRIYDIISPFTSYTKLYTSGGAFVIYPDYPSSSIQFYCRTAGNLEVQTFYSFATGNTSAVPFAALSTSNFSGIATFNTWVYLNFRTRIYDLNGLGNFTQMYMLGNALILAPDANGDTIQFYCKDAILGQLQTFTSAALGNTSNVNLTCSASLISNNLTSPTTTSTNNIYTSLVSGGVINMGGSLGSNNIAGLTTFTEATTFNDNARFNSRIDIFNGVNNSSINQSTNLLNIKNLFQGGSISLQTVSVSAGTADRLIIDAVSCDILPSTLNLTSSSTINILTPNNLTGVINFLSSLTTATINFCSTAYTAIFNLNARLAHKQVQYMNEVKTISGTSATLSFPLEQRWMFKSTGATQIVVDLPELTASHQAGFYFSLFKTASNTNSVKINRQGTNVIRSYNSITDLTTDTILSGSGSTLSIITAEISAGVFAWIVTA